MMFRYLPLLLPTPVLACPDHVLYEPDHDPAIVGHITYDNPVMGCSPETLLDITTSHGTVTVLLTVTPNGPEMRPDTLEVTALPYGVGAWPHMIIVSEGGTGKITLLVWEGV